MKRILVTLGALSMLAGPATAQTSAQDIAALVDEKMAAVDEYAALLNDPDPDRSLAAMQIMIGLDDAQISRMALQFGITSTSSAVRRAALKAFFDSGPMLNIFIDGAALDRENLTAAITQQSGTVDGAGVSFLSYKVGGFDAKEGCYDFQKHTNYCLVSLSESNVGINLWGRWTPLVMTAEGNLEGMVQVDRLTPSVPVRIPVRP